MKSGVVFKCGKLSVNGMGVKAPPHDILKVLTWRGHGRRDQRGRFGHTNLEHLKEIEALDGYEELADAISSILIGFRIKLQHLQAGLYT